MTTAHPPISLRAPLPDGEGREAGVGSTTELGVLALEALARPDPVAAFFQRTEGQLGPDHSLDY